MPAAISCANTRREKKRKIAWKYRNQLKRIDAMHFAHHTYMHEEKNVSSQCRSLALCRSDAQNIWISLHLYIPLVCLFACLFNACILAALDSLLFLFFLLYYATDSHLWHCNKLIFLQNIFKDLFKMQIDTQREIERWREQLEFSLELWIQ